MTTSLVKADGQLVITVMRLHDQQANRVENDDRLLNVYSAVWMSEQRAATLIKKSMSEQQTRCSRWPM